MNKKKIDLNTQLVLALAALSQDADNPMIETKIEALFKLREIINSYLKYGFLEELVFSIFAKKADFLINATSKQDIKEILSPAKVHYDGNEIIPNGRYHVREEELLLWSLTSLNAPLNEYGLKRYMKLFMEIFPDQGEILDL